MIRKPMGNISARAAECVLACLIVATLAQGCAHRNRLPECKGPYTPINLSTVAEYHGPQR
jgi:hypothetical protein